MKRILRYLFPIFFFLIPVTLLSQDALNVLDRVYGLDQTLCNGKKYTYLILYSTKGHQYLLSPEYIDGSVTIKGTCYQDITLNYDIFNQELLLRYEDEKGILKTIEVSKAWLTNFSLGNMNFEFLNLEQEPRFYQVLGKGPLRILYYWQKYLSLDGTIGSSGYLFTLADRDSFVLMDGQLKRFKTKRSLIRLFEPEHRPKIKSYMRKNKINMKRASDEAMAEMITFIGNIK